jgi:hypothetical protein
LLLLPSVIMVFPCPWLDCPPMSTEVQGSSSTRARWEKEPLASLVPCLAHGVHHPSLSACILLIYPSVCDKKYVLRPGDKEMET